MGSIPEFPAISCLEIKASERENTISGKYWLDPTGTGKGSGGRSYNFLFDLFYIFITMIFLVSIISRYIEANSHFYLNSWMLVMEREF